MSENGARVRVLLADDNDAVREVLGQILAQESSIELVGAASNAEQAIELAARHRPDVALIDVRMPGGGVHATREICRR